MPASPIRNRHPSGGMPYPLHSSRKPALLGFAGVAALFMGCFEGGTRNRDVDFDREALLTRWADALILPAYRDLAAATEKLEGRVEAFAESPDSAGADSARAALRAAWTAWQKTSPFEFGPAAEILLRDRLNKYPTKSELIETNIADGSWNLESASNYLAKGFPALDYLLHGGPGDTTSVVSAFADGEAAESRRAYLLDVAGEIAESVTEVLEAWESDGGNYRADFISKQGTDIGSSLGEAVNEYVRDYELMKNAKVGIPLGVRTLGYPMEEQVEAYYGGYSAALARTQLAASEDFFRGRDADGTDGIGLDDYLAALGTRYQDGELAQAILDQYAAAATALDEVPDPLSQAILEETEKVEAAYEALQRMVVLIKTDLSSALSVSITYQDNDGD